MSSHFAKFSYVWDVQSDSSDSNDKSRLFKCSLQYISYGFRLVIKKIESEDFLHGIADACLGLEYVSGPSDRIQAKIMFHVGLKKKQFDPENSNLYYRPPETRSLAMSRSQFTNHQVVQIEDVEEIEKIECSITLVLTGFHNCVERPQFEVPLKQNVKMFNDILKGRLAFHDVKLISSDNYVFECNKNFLACKSEVFDRMFNTPMAESLENEVFMKDIDHVVLTEILRYVYTNQIGEIVSELCVELVMAADQYNFMLLKCFCSLVMYDKLNVENAIEFLIIADRFDIAYVKEKAICIINEYSAQLERTEEWQKLKDDFPELFYDISEDFFSKMNVTVVFI